MVCDDRCSSMGWKMQVNASVEVKHLGGKTPRFDVYPEDMETYCSTALSGFK